MVEHIEDSELREVIDKSFDAGEKEGIKQTGTWLAVGLVVGFILGGLFVACMFKSCGLI